MAKPNEVLECLDLLFDSGLDYTPKHAGKIADAWVQVFADIPGPVFRQAVSDYLKLESKWPAPAKLRELAEKVKANNARTTAGGQFADPSRLRAPLKGIARVTADGWMAVFAEDLHPEQAPELDDIEPPAHPEFTSWAEAQAWQEAQREGECTPL